MQPRQGPQPLPDFPRQSSGHSRKAYTSLERNERRSFDSASLEVDHFAENLHVHPSVQKQSLPSEGFVSLFTANPHTDSGIGLVRTRCDREVAANYRSGVESSPERAEPLVHRKTPSTAAVYDTELQPQVLVRRREGIVHQRASHGCTAG
ncbi:uncharacterized protein LOC5565131 [Aedes aegypti]|uniref:Uncharacterized protein n=1 Tax=Aedes aegypti TaxID=7159 RepID=A0A6I8U918_AEDAE|nr:uncharacterized protein LOC110674824 [Aedes aegypti]XP_021694970.1 uncharacterized protein LOC5565131 [Aedes aegypti]